jgi:hypothetical protein
VKRPNTTAGSAYEAFPRGARAEAKKYIQVVVTHFGELMLRNASGKDLTIGTDGDRGNGIEQT